MKFLKSLIVLVLSVVSNHLQGQIECIPIQVVNEQTLPFKSGEYLSYTIRYRWGAINSDIGEATFFLQQIPGSGESFYSAKLTGGTTKFYDMFFKAKEYYESRFSTKNLKPTYFYRDVKEGKYSVKNNIEFSQGNKIRAKVQKNNKEWADTLLQGKDCTFDVISLFYFMRSLDIVDMSTGSERGLSVVIDGELYNLGYRFVGRENKRIPGMGPRKTLKFAAKVIAGQFFSGKEEMHIWVSDDKNRVPLYFETPVKVGRVSGRLNKYANLKFQTDDINLY